MLKRLLLVSFVIIFALIVEFHTARAFLPLVFGLVCGGFLYGLDWYFDKYSNRNIPAGVFGFFGGSLLAVLLLVLSLQGTLYFREAPLQFKVSYLLPVGVLILGLGYIGARLAVEMAKRKTPRVVDETSSEAGSIPKLLDTSVIVDGRIAEIVDTGFLEGPFIVPKFIIKELQNMADSGNRMKRERGRRGLDVLNRIRSELPVEVIITEQVYPNVPEVDSKLVAAASELGAKVITNDFNLNKVAQLQGIDVLNINDLSNAVKPVFIPGETFEIEVIKAGEEEQQGVGYLEDGTMVVVEEGRNNVGEKITVTVTSVIQTSAGRMIFARPGEEEAI